MLLKHGVDLLVLFGAIRRGHGVGVAGIVLVIDGGAAVRNRECATVIGVKVNIKVEFPTQVLV